MILFMDEDKSSVDRWQEFRAYWDLLIEFDRSQMVAILCRFLNLVHRLQSDDFVIELISVDHELTIHHIYDEQILDYFRAVHQYHPTK